MNSELNSKENSSSQFSVKLNKMVVKRSEKFIEESFSDRTSLIEFASTVNERHEIFESLLLLQNVEFTNLLDKKDAKSVINYIAKKNGWLLSDNEQPQPRAIPINIIAFFNVAAVGALYFIAAVKTFTQNIKFSDVNKFYSPLIFPEIKRTIEAIAEYSGEDFAIEIDRTILDIATEDIKARYMSNYKQEKITDIELSSM
ncbi:hypothetical protein [Candidatus Enterococcus clewellii]|uniref:Uncharacterized protein n=1 Tax=Candidatus Enterococcus clewellii TaxID=1834193 RepID=A0AAQ3VZI0_9ENTE